MKPSTISQLQKELKSLDKNEVAAICVRIAKYKKENKELLSYLLFDASDEKNYIENIKKEMDDLFFDINRKSTYTTKKGLQKIVRAMNRYIKYSDIKQTEIELRVYFCKKVKAARISLNTSSIISNLYYREHDKIKIAFLKLHEDLQYDYRAELEGLGITDV